MNLRIGIIGVGRRRNGIGEYVAKFCSRARAEVVAHVSSSMERAILHANDLAAKYQILSKPYSDIEKFFVNEKLDAVAICTPALLHKVQLDAALAHSVHVFCEKPLLWESNGMVEKTKDILNAFEEANLVLYQDTQWISTLSVFEQFYSQLNLENIRSFSIELYPPDSDSKSMISEEAPHPNSLLLALGGKPPAEALSVQLLHCVREESELKLCF